MKILSLGILTLILSVGANGATISGTVTSDSGSPLTAMTVAAYTSAGALSASGGTTSSGTYAPTVPAGTYHVLAYDPTGTFATSFYADAESFDTSASVAVTSTQNATNINFRLVRSGFIVGRVSSTTSGASLPNVTVVAYNLSGTRRGFTSTDSTGSYTLALPAGTFKLVAYDDALAYVPTFFDNATSFAAAAAIAVASMESTTANLKLPLAAKVTGSVTDRGTLAPLAAMRATAYASDGSIAQSLTGSDGRFAMAARAGALRVVVDDPSGNYAATYVPDAESFSTESAVTATAGQTLTISATMVRAGRLAGRVTNRVSGAPLANMTAVAYNTDGTTRSFANSDATGAYSIVVPSGDFRVGVFDSALVYLPQFYPNQATFNAAMTQHAIAQQAIGALDFALSKGARVTAHVSSRTSGAALPAITVGAYDLGGDLLLSTTTDGSGNGTLLLTSGTVKLLAFDTNLQFATGYYLDAPTFDAAQALALSEGQSFDASFSLADAGRISGVVSDAMTAAPLGGITVIVYDANFQRVVEATTDAAGAFRLAVPEGTYVVAAADPAHRYGTVFYSGSTTPATASSVSVFAGQDVGPLAMRLAIAPTPARRRAARH